MIPGIAKGVAESQALKVYVCNVAEEPRQTVGYSVQDHLDVLRRYVGEESVHAVVANGNIPHGPTPAGLDFITPRLPWDDVALLVEADVIDQGATARHDPLKLASIVASTYQRHRGKRRRLPRPRPAGQPQPKVSELQSEALCSD